MIRLSRVWSLLCVSSVVLLLNACCSVPDVRAFERLTLDQKLSIYERATREGCVRGAKLALLAKIADHGIPAAVAMAVWLRESSSVFPALDAIDVIRFVHFKGHDLRQHDATQALHELAQTASDLEVRSEAAKAFHQIMTNTASPAASSNRPNGGQ